MPFQFVWSMNVGEVITVLSILATFCFTQGRLIQRVEHCEQSQGEDRLRFQNHEQQDIERFDSLASNLNLIASKVGEK